MIGDGSNLKVGKLENTAAAIGTTGSGKLSIDEYVGHDLENVDKLKTVGGSVGISASGITSLGVNYSDKKQEGITKNTVIGNVEIGKSSGDEINRDLDTMTEITKDRKFETNVNIESQTINYIKNPEKFKEDLQKAKNEVEDLENAVKNTLVEGLGRQFKAREINEEDLKEAVRDVVKGYGKEALEGKQDKKVAEDRSNDEEGLESLGRPANEYVKKRIDK